MKRNKFSKRRERPVAKNCGFCAAKTVPDYKDVAVLSKFVTDRGKILSRARTGICSKHQRVVTRAVKRSRQVALLPFVVRA